MNEELFEEIGQLKKSDYLVIAEGPKDRAALEHFEIRNIITLSKKPLFHIIEEIVKTGKEVAILTDLDKKGKELYGRINSELQRFGVKVNNDFRKFLFRETKLRQIEGLVTYTHNH